MITELKKQEILSVKSFLDTCKANVSATKDELLKIDDKYRRLAEEEKKTLKEQLKEYSSMQKTWEKMFNGFETSAVEEVLGAFESTQTESADSITQTSSTVEEKVVDTLYADEVEEVPELKEEPVVEEPEELVPVELEDLSGLEEEELKGIDETPFTPEEAIVPDELENIPSDAVALNDEGWAKLSEEWS